MKLSPEENSIERAAIFLMSLKSEEASKVLKHLGAKEVQKIGQAMANLNKVGKKEVSKVYSDFMLEAENQTSIGVDKDAQIRKVLIGALGEERAASVIDKVLTSSDNHTTTGLETLKWMDAKAITEMIQDEHPQIQAIVLTYLEPDQAGQVLNNLDENTRFDLIERISTQEAVQPAALEELNHIVEKQLSHKKMLQPKIMGGKQCAVNILKNIDSKAEAKIFEAMHEKNKNLAEEIEELMFIFDNLKKVDDKGFQVLLREIKVDTLVVAMKAIDEDMKEKIFRNMSKRAAELLKDDLENKGPVKVSDVEQAQKDIIVIAKKLAEEGKISLGTDKEEML